MRDGQACGWLAAGVLALGLNGFYHDGGAQWAHRVLAGAACRSESVIASASGRVEQFLCEKGLTPSGTHGYRVEAAIARLQGEAARGQAGFARAEASSARQEAALARLQANRARIEAQMARVRDMSTVVGPMNVAVDCPRVHVMVPRIDIPQVRIPEIRIPEIRVPEINVNLPAPTISAVEEGDPI
jgi:hypothetical protein